MLNADQHQIARVKREGLLFTSTNAEKANRRSILCGSVTVRATLLAFIAASAHSVAPSSDRPLSPKQQQMLEPSSANEQVRST